MIKKSGDAKQKERMNLAKDVERNIAMLQMRREKFLLRSSQNEVVVLRQDAIMLSFFAVEIRTRFRLGHDSL